MSEKLAVNSQKDLNDSKNYLEFRKIAEEGLLKFGKISINYLMRKLKCTESMAKEIINEICEKT